ncbi:MAG TPA: hypothetical protein VD971_02920 [Phycisphaerales bacterium]|nr:hypothetical protein [Phycisphaerales bacterium]
MGEQPTNATVADPAPAHQPRAGAGPRALIVLSGGVRTSRLSEALGRSLLDLPLPGAGTLLATWRQHAAGLAGELGIDRLALRVMVSKPLALPRPVPGHERLGVTLEYDKIELRGTGGLLRDLAEDYADDDELLVVAGHQALLRPLADLYKLMRAVGGDMTLLAEADGSAVGVHLVRCGALRDVRAKGYVDLKEQALPEIARTRIVRVATSPRRAAMPIRTLDQYMRVLRVLTEGADADAANDPYAEEWTPTFALVDAGARVARTAVIHDSVVMNGAAVGDGAVLVRSLVCEDAHVEPGSLVFDSVVSSARQAAGGGR